MTDRADELAQDLIPERATRIMVDTRGGDRRVYSADEWREHLVAALRAYAEEARQEESKACANMLVVAAMAVEDTAKYRVYDVQARGLRDIAAAIRARGGER